MRTDTNYREKIIKTNGLASIWSIIGILFDSFHVGLKPMTSSPLCSTERMESRIGLLMAQSEKQALFAAAAKHNVTASDFVRAAVATLAAADEDDRRQMIAKALVR